jgi:hypothetical protein
MTKRYVISGLALLLASSALHWFFRPSAAYDLDRVNVRLRSLQTPYQVVRTAYYLDGGSIGIEIVDRDGRREQFCLPSHLGDTNRYSRVFVGAMHDRKAGAVEVTEPEHTKRMLIQVLASMPKRTADDDICLMALRRRPSDFAVCLIHKWTGKYDR